MPRIVPPKNKLTALDNLDRIPKHRRDWLCIFGNTWGTKHHGERMTEDEKRNLLDALNPFKRTA